MQYPLIYVSKPNKSGLRSRGDAFLEGEMLVWRRSEAANDVEKYEMINLVVSRACTSTFRRNHRLLSVLLCPFNAPPDLTITARIFGKSFRASPSNYLAAQQPDYHLNGE